MAQTIQSEFTKNSAIAKDVFILAVDIVQGLEFDPVVKEVTGTPLYNLLGWNYVRFGHKPSPNLVGACFKQETGELWQAKVYGKSKDVKRSGDYYAPKGIGDKAYLPPVPPRVRRAIAEINLEESPKDDESFWEWFKPRKDIPLVLTEGGKKALALLSLNWATIALYGCSCGAKSKDNNGNPTALKLTPELTEFCQGRDVFIALDKDSKYSTQQKVNQATEKLCKAILKAGGKPFIVNWDKTLGKGIDDVAATAGSETVNRIIRSAIPYEQWQIARYFSLDSREITKINVRFIPYDKTILDKGKMIAIQSPYFTGKTKWFEDVVDDWISKGGEVIVPVHRIQLAKALAKRLGIDHIDEVRSSDTKGILGYSLCIESLHPKSKARFNPDNYCNVRPVLLIMDEVDQVIPTVLDSMTCSDNRYAIIKTLQELIQRIEDDEDSRILLADNDLSLVSIEFLEGLASGSIKTHIIQNDYKFNGHRELIVYDGNDPSQIVAALFKAIEEGKRVLIHTASQSIEYKWSSQNLELEIQQRFPEKKGIRIDRETTGEPDHPACGLLEKDINPVLLNYDYAICTPVVETGISIETNNHFDSVWIIAQGVQTVDAVCQSAERNRDNVPRHLWAPAKTSKGIWGDGSTSVYDLMIKEQKKADLTIKSLQLADNIGQLSSSHPKCLLTWAKYGCKINTEKKAYRENIVKKFKSNGYIIKSPSTDKEELREMGKALKDEHQQTVNDNYNRQVSEVKLSPNPSNEEYKVLREQRRKTKEERLKERKGTLCRKYATEDITEDMIKRDDKGWYGQLRLHYYLTIGKPFYKARDIKRLTELAKDLPDNEKILSEVDINRICLSTLIFSLEYLKIHQFLDPDQHFTSRKLSEWFEVLKTPEMRYQIKLLTGVTINPDKDSAIGVANRFLKKIGLNLEYIGCFWFGGERERTYRLQSLNPDGRDEIFARWLERDKKGESQDTIA